MTTKKRMTTEQKIDLLTKQLQELKKKLKTPKATELNKDSEGVKEAISALEHVVTVNKVSMGEVIKLVSRLKRTGLRIQDAVKKSKKIAGGSAEFPVVA